MSIVEQIQILSTRIEPIEYANTLTFLKESLPTLDITEQCYQFLLVVIDKELEWDTFLKFPIDKERQLDVFGYYIFVYGSSTYDVVRALFRYFKWRAYGPAVAAYFVPSVMETMMELYLFIWTTLNPHSMRSRFNRLLLSTSAPWLDNYKRLQNTPPVSVFMYRGRELLLAKDLTDLVTSQWVNDTIINAYRTVAEGGAQLPLEPPTEPMEEQERIRSSSLNDVSIAGKDVQQGSQGGEQLHLQGVRGGGPLPLAFPLALPLSVFVFVRWEYEKHYHKDPYFDTSLYSKLLIPVHVHGTHWTLACFDSDRRTVRYYDSLKGYPAQRLKDDLKTLAEHIFKTSRWRWEEWKGPQQRNSVDCGIYVMQRMVDTMRGIERRKFPPSKEMRARIFRELWYSQLEEDPARDV
jgi:hypothetical protein